MLKDIIYQFKLRKTSVDIYLPLLNRMSYSILRDEKFVSTIKINRTNNPSII